jgi:hypothetical protein
MFVLSKEVQVCLRSLAPRSCSIKGSFLDRKPVYIVFVVSKISHSLLLISSYPTFDDAKEVINQINLAMDNILIS